MRAVERASSGLRSPRWPSRSRPPRPRPSKDRRTSTVQLLAINDFHGHLAPTRRARSRSAAATRSPTPAASDRLDPEDRPGRRHRLPRHAHQAAARRRTRTRFAVGAGDMIGASPLVSALFHDEPTIEALNSIGFDDIGVGNHEFDEGDRPSCSACSTATSTAATAATRSTAARTATPFSGAFFKFLAANVFYEGTGKTIFPPYEIKKFGNAKIALHRHDLRGHADRRDAVRRRRPASSATRSPRPTRSCRSCAREQGVKAFVVLLHQGGAQTRRPPAYPAPRPATPTPTSTSA